MLIGDTKQAMSKGKSGSVETGQTEPAATALVCVCVCVCVKEGGHVVNYQLKDHHRSYHGKSPHNWPEVQVGAYTTVFVSAWLRYKKEIHGHLLLHS